MKKSLIFLLAFLLNVAALYAQNNEYTQVIRGQVTDKQTNTPLPGATIVIMGSDPLIGTSSDGGYFTYKMCYWT
jgi:hypothetical protein